MAPDNIHKTVYYLNALWQVDFAAVGGALKGSHNHSPSISNHQNGSRPTMEPSSEAGERWRKSAFPGVSQACGGCKRTPKSWGPKYMPVSVVKKEARATPSTQGVKEAKVLERRIGNQSDTQTVSTLEPAKGKLREAREQVTKGQSKNRIGEPC